MQHTDGVIACNKEINSNIKITSEGQKCYRMNIIVYSSKYTVITKQ